MGVGIQVYLRNTLCDFNIHALMIQNVSAVSGCGYSTVPEVTLDIQVCTSLLVGVGRYMKLMKGNISRYTIAIRCMNLQVDIIIHFNALNMSVCL